MSQASGQSKKNTDQAHRERLERLEEELALLRRELGDDVDRLTAPKANFRALTFEVETALYGVPIEIVREVVRYVKLTPVSDVPDPVVGAINVRGEVLPVIDARRRLGQPVTSPGLRTPILLLSTGRQSFGLIVDAVHSVDEIDASTISQPTGTMVRSACVAGVATIGSRVVQLLDADRTLSVRQWRNLHAKLTGPAAAERPLVAATEEPDSKAAKSKKTAAKSGRTAK
jgi:purine-binding chemotaxis protein CheW